MTLVLLATLAVAPRLQVQVGHQGAIPCLDVRDGLIALGSHDRTASLYDMEGRQLKALGGAGGKLHEICLGPRGKFLSARIDTGSPSYFPMLGTWETRSKPALFNIPKIDRWGNSEEESDYWVTPAGLFVRGETRWSDLMGRVKVLPGRLASVDEEGHWAVVQVGSKFLRVLSHGSDGVPLVGAEGEVFALRDGAVAVRGDEIVRFDSQGRLMAKRSLAELQFVDRAGNRVLVYTKGRLELLGPKLETLLSSDPRPKPQRMRFGEIRDRIDTVATTTGFAEYRGNELILRNVGRREQRLFCPTSPAWSQSRAHVGIPTGSGMTLIRAVDGKVQTQIKFASDTRAVWTDKEDRGLIVAGGQRGLYFDLEIGRPTWSAPTEELGLFGPDWGQRSPLGHTIFERANGWDVREIDSGALLTTLLKSFATQLESTRSGRSLVAFGPSAVVGVSLASQPRELWRLDPLDKRSLDAAAGGWMFRRRGDTLEWFDLDSLPPTRQSLTLKLDSPWGGPVAGPASPDGRWLSYLDNSVTPVVFKPMSGTKFSLDGMANSYAGFSSKGSYFYGMNPNRDAWVWRTEDGKLIREVYAERDGGHGMFAYDESALFLPSASGNVRVIELPFGATHQLRGHEGRVISMAQIPSRGVTVTRSVDGMVKLWRRKSELCTIVVDRTGKWVVVAPDGRFDTNRPEDVDFLQWIVEKGDVPSATPLETYLREYFEPFLLRKLLKDEPLAPLPPLQVRSLPAAPQIEAPPSSSGKVTLQVTVRQPLQKLIVLRDGVLVAEIAKPKVGTLTPSVEIKQDTTFAVYGFDARGLKTPNKSIRVRFTGPPSKPRAWVVAIGIDRYADPALRLNVAASDARDLSRALSERLVASDRYRSVQTRVVSDRVGTASLAEVRAAFKWLAQVAEVGDVVILSWSGHGLTSKNGFQFLTSDATRSRPAGLGMEELRSLMLPISASRILVALDTCYAAATVEAEGFRPGPLGGRSFGQLAYDKAMFVISATQATSTALESNRLGHGLLTYALLAALEERPTASFTELGVGAASRVPALFRRVIEGSVRAGSASASKLRGSAQRAALFDFRVGDWGVMY